LARQADEHNVDPNIRRHIASLEQKLAEQDKRWNDWQTKREQQEQHQRYQQGLAQDVDNLVTMGGDANRAPNLAALPVQLRQEYAHRAVARAVQQGDTEATLGSILDELEDEVSGWVQHVRGFGRAQQVPEPRDEPPPARQNARVRAASALGSAAPASAQPKTEDERRLAANDLARRLRREKEERQKTGTRSR
jgi:hypothetical protein